ncbi:MrcB family domain-containing protein [Streptomyces sp. LMG1-1-1.1]|uniref:MrcB family domain-containing protein n=1 Tax=Streptomyces sp. LMG1-1-1.1 TaxID=3135245 RepID=UPI003467BFDF
MGIRDLLSEVASTYDRSAGSRRDVVGQQVLRAVASRTDLALPHGYKAQGHGGQTTPAATPWIGIFAEGGDKDPKRGLYLAYIFSADLKSVALTLQQGITWLERRLGRGRAREEHLRHHAARLRRAVKRRERQGWVDEPELRDNAARPRAYEAASVITKTYETAELPSDVTLMEDLLSGIGLLHRVQEADRAWWMSDDADDLEVSYEPHGHAHPVPDPLAGFHPKDSSDYVVEIKARQQVKRRTHEKLVEDFGDHIVGRGYVPITLLQHPKDLVLRQQDAEGSEEWLVEAKVVRNGNPTVAVREALGQLYEYRHFLYREKPEPFLIGLFSEEIGVYASYLEERGIASVWRSGDGWGGSPRSQDWGMTAD